MKRTKNRIISVFVVFCMVLTLLPTAALPAKAATSGNYTYSDNEDGTVTIIEYSGSGRAVTIPSTLGGKSVTGIGGRAFYNCTSLTSITILDSVMSIGYDAFYYCTNLTSITIPDSVTSIGRDAFRDTAWFNSQPDGVVYAGKIAYIWKGTMFANTSITLRSDTKGIADLAFSNCTSLNEITIPDSVTSIGWAVFYNCTNLTSIIIPNGVTSIGDSAFQHCKSLTSITFPNSVTSIGDSAFRYCASLTSITIPDSVTSIGELAFSACTSLTSIIIPDSVTSISSYAFNNCTSLTSVIIPDSVTSIGNDAFSNCTSLTSITIPAGVTSIGNYAFSGCTSLTSITIPDSVTNIGYNAFSDCSSLTSITIPDSVTNIGYSAFRDCTSLISITIPDGITSIGERTFSGCTSLISITIPDSVTSIGSNAFHHTKWYETQNDGVVYAGKVAYIWKGNMRANTSITLRSDTKGIADYAFNNCTSLTSVIIPDSVTSIGNDAFRNCTGLTEITIPDSVTSIGNDAFRNCTGLTEITIPDSVTNIGYNAFSGCSSLTSITIPDSVTSIDSWAFSSCSSLTSITIGNGVTSIDSFAFQSCTSLTEITIPDSVMSIDKYAFSNCTSLTEINVDSENKEYSSLNGVLFNKNQTTLISYPEGKTDESYTIPYGVTSIGSVAFRYCSSLETITIPDSVTSIDDSAFYGCSSLESITIPDGVTINGGYIFMYCYSLKSITIGDGVTRIPYHMVYGCTSLTSITIPDSVIYIDEEAFYGCNLGSITVGASVTNIYKKSFNNCTSLKSITFKRVVPPNFDKSAFPSITGNVEVFVPINSGAAYKKALTGILNNFTVEETCFNCGECYVCDPCDCDECNNQCRGFYGYDWHFFNGVLTIKSNQSTTAWRIGRNTDTFIIFDAKTIIIEDNTKSIDEGAFRDCESLTSVIFKNSTPPNFSSDVFLNCYDLSTIYVPKNSKAAYESVSQLSPYDVVEYTYTVIFDSQGGSTVDSIDEAIPNDIINEPDEPTRGSYVFGGWYKESNYENLWNFNTDIIKDNTTLYAKWIPTYTITYNLNGGINPVNPQTNYTYGINTYLPEPTHSNTGLLFDGWYLSSDFSGTPIESTGTTRTGNLTLYAKWTVKKSYIVTYNANGGTGEPNFQIKEHNTPLYLSGMMPSRDCYEFRGWAINSVATSPNYLSGAIYTDNNDITLYAVWRLDSHTRGADDCTKCSVCGATGLDINCTVNPCVLHTVVTTTIATTTPAPTTSALTTTTSATATPTPTTTATQPATTTNAPATTTAKPTTPPNDKPTLPIDPCASCKLCTKVTKEGYSSVKGRILGTDEPQIFDFVEILQFLVKIPDCQISKCGNALYASLLSPQGKAAGEPTIFCGVEILQYLVGITDGKDW